MAKQEKPKFLYYTLSGTIYDSRNNKGLGGVKILPGLCKFTDKYKNVTNEEGKYTVEIEIGNTKLSKSKQSFTSLYFQKKGFISKSYKIFDGGGNVKSDLPIISLPSIKEIEEKAIKDVKEEIDERIDEQLKKFQEPVDAVVVALRKKILKFVSSMQIRVIPLVIKLLVAFGITNIADIKNINLQTCPTPSELKGIIRRRNSIAKQLNQIYSTIAIQTAFAGIMLYISFHLKGLVKTLDNLPIPLSVPPGVGLPYSFVGKLQSVTELVKKLAKENKNISKQVLISLVFLVVVLIIALIYLKSIDKLIKKCYEEDANSGEKLKLTPISSELLELAKNQETEESKSKPVGNYNGFIFSVVNTKEDSTLQRRNAIAKNESGVILLKGEPSFSAEDQILIDELVFYIKSNNLKAY